MWLLQQGLTVTKAQQNFNLRSFLCNWYGVRGFFRGKFSLLQNKETWDIISALMNAVIEFTIGQRDIVHWSSKKIEREQGSVTPQCIQRGEGIFQFNIYLNSDCAITCRRSIVCHCSIPFFSVMNYQWIRILTIDNCVMLILQVFQSSGIITFQSLNHLKVDSLGLQN